MAFKTILRTFYITLLLSQHLALRAQQPTPDSAIYEKALSSILTASHKDLGNNLRLYTGAEYIPNGQRALGYPYFQSDSLLTGAVYYDGIRYDNIALQYDLVTDEVITRDTINNVSISFVKEKLPRFTISGHTFIRLATPYDSTAVLRSGFYELLFDGQHQLVARYKKKLVFPTNGEDAIKYAATNMFFLRHNGQYIRIEGQRGLLNALEDNRDALKKYIRKNKPDFKHNPGDAMTQVLQYYTQLKN